MLGESEGAAATRPGSGKRVAVLQSNYIPWKGYFDIIASVDEFIVYDSVQYTKNDWRNRNQIKTAHGKAWLTVPVRQQSLGQTIEATEIADPGCFRKHWNSFRQSYARAAHIEYCTDVLAPLFLEATTLQHLSQANLHFMKGICAALGIETRIRSAREFNLDGDRNGRLVSLCTQAGASTYLSGPAARDYVDEGRFREAGIEVEWMQYRYQEYAQPHPPFDHFVTVLDLVACTGSNARHHLAYARGVAP